jgi:hypothetical protein
LIELAVKKPYGWAWTEIDRTVLVCNRDHVERATEEHGCRRDGQARVPRAVGFSLLVAGQFLNDQRYIDSAHEAARGAAAFTHEKWAGIECALPSAPAPAGAKAPAYVPPRDATVAALGLMLADSRRGR